MINRGNSISGHRRARRTGLAAGALATAMLGSSAQAALVSACSGVSLPRSVVTGIIAGPLNGIVTPTQGRINGILTGLAPITGLLGVLPAPLSIDVAGLLTNAAAGNNITLQALDRNGQLVGPADQCIASNDGYALNTPAGISIGGNQITGLGSGTQASAGSLGAIALGNGASTTAGATNSVAFGTNASATAANSVALGAGSTATRGAVTGYAAPGLATPQTSAGEVSVGTAGGTRQITNVAAGSAPTDAVNVSQVSAAITASAGAAPVQYSNAATPTTPNGGVPTNDVTLVGGAAGPVTIHNVAAGSVAPGSTDAVNGGQLATTNQNVTNNTNSIAGNTTSITNLTNGTIGIVRQVGGAPGTGTVTVGAQTGGALVDFTGTGGSRVLTGVAPGAIAAGSTDAVDGGQLFATNTSITNLITNINGGGIGLVRQTGGTPGSGPITIGAGTGGTNINIAGTGGNRTISGVAAGVNGTDAVNLNQLNAIGASSANAVQYDVTSGGTRLNSVTLAGGTSAPVTVTNVAPAALNAGSTDAVNGSQLFATNQNVATNTNNIANNTTAITNLTNGTAGLVQQTGGAPGTGTITVGAATGGTTINVAGTGGNRIITGVAPGLAANDAATVGQLAMVSGGGLNAVQYDTDSGGGRLNSVTLIGGTDGPVRITNVAPGSLAAGSTDAVNGSQLGSLTTIVNGNSTTITNIVNGQAGAFRSDNTAGAAAPSASGANSTAGGFGAVASGPRDTALGNNASTTGTNSVALGYGSSDGGQSNVVSIGSGGAERRLTNVGPGLNGTDAVNLSQLQAVTNQFQVTTGDLQNQINGIDYDLSRAKRLANAGTAGAMAVAGLPQAFTPGKGMIAGAVGYWQNQVAFAVGLSKIVGERTVVKAGGSVSGRGTAGFNAGVGFEF